MINLWHFMRNCETYRVHKRKFGEVDIDVLLQRVHRHLNFAKSVFLLKQNLEVCWKFWHYFTGPWSAIRARSGRCFTWASPSGKSWDSRRSRRDFVRKQQKQQIRKIQNCKIWKMQKINIIELSSEKLVRGDRLASIKLAVKRKQITWRDNWRRGDCSMKWTRCWRPHCDTKFGPCGRATPLLARGGEISYSRGNVVACNYWIKKIIT